MPHNFELMIESIIDEILFDNTNYYEDEEIFIKDIIMQFLGLDYIDNDIFSNQEIAGIINDTYEVIIDDINEYYKKVPDNLKITHNEYKEYINVIGITTVV